MSAVTVSAIHTRAMESTVQLKPTLRTASFQDLFASVSETASKIVPTPILIASQSTSLQEHASIVVRRGDTLSRICANELKNLRGAVSQRETYAAVLQVARANHIANPDMIHPGQKLDLSILANRVSGQESSSTMNVLENAKPWKSLVEGAVALSSEFGLRKDPFTGRMKQHDGIDIAAPAGSPISALEAGSVIFSGWKHGYGNTVIVKHEDGLETIYGHLSKSLVHVGEQVESHTLIAYVGSTGRSTGPHLHFEVRRDGQALDPHQVVLASVE